METDAAMEKQERFFHSSLQNAWAFRTVPTGPAGDESHSTINLGVGQYCSIKVGQFYVVKKTLRREEEKQDR